MTEEQKMRGYVTFIGRRKSDPVPIKMNLPPRRFFEKWPVIVGIVLVSVLVISLAVMR